MGTCGWLGRMEKRGTLLFYDSESGILNSSMVTFYGLYPYEEDSSYNYTFFVLKYSALYEIMTERREPLAIAIALQLQEKHEFFCPQA